MPKDYLLSIIIVNPNFTNELLSFIALKLIIYWIKSIFISHVKDVRFLIEVF